MQNLQMKNYLLLLLALSLFACETLSSSRTANTEPQSAPELKVDLEKRKLQQNRQLLLDSLTTYKKQLAYLKRASKARPQSIVIDTSQLELLRKDSLMRGFVRQIFTASPTPNYPLRINIFNNSFDAMIVKLKKSNVQFYWSFPKTQIPYRTFGNLKNAIKRTENKKLIFATNAGMFTPAMEPKGLYIENGQLIQPLDTISGRVGYLNFYLQPNGVFYITNDNTANIIQTQEYRFFPPSNIAYATQSGPMLVIDNEIHPAFNKDSVNKYIRSGVGLIDEDHLVFIISNQPVNFYDFAMLFRDYFGCQNALYLDGAISDMYLPELKREYLNGNFGPIIGIVE